MTQEEQKILLQDLCARLPHDVNVWVKTHHGQIIESDILTLCNGGGYYSTLTYEGIMNDSVVKPYLRPFSEMTEEEKKEYKDLLYCVKYADDTVLAVNMLTDWLNAHHFDYRGLIPMGLALKAPEGMYNVVNESE